jgi:cyclase
MQTVELRRGVFACLSPNAASNAGFVTSSLGTVVIDTLSSPQMGRQLAETAALHSDRPIVLVTNTHHHSDHVFGNQAFEAPIVAHCALAGELARVVAQNLTPDEVAAWVAEHPEDGWLRDELQIRYPNIVFDDHLLVELPPRRIAVQHLGGHTPDSSVVDLPDEEVLFAGDLVFEGRTPYLRDANFRECVAALRSLEKLGKRTVVPGHGVLCDMGYVTWIRDYLEALIDSAQRRLEAGWPAEAILDSGDLPGWPTADRPDLQRANIARLLAELAAGPASQ